MKNLFKPTNLPKATAALGIIGLVLRRLLYAFGPDSKNLLPNHHPLEILLALLSAAALAYILITVWKLDGSNRYVDNFGPSLPAAVGHVLAAAGILLTVLLNDPMMPGTLGKLWKVLGFLSAPCLIAAGCIRVKGKRPFFVLHLVVCLFLVFHIVNQYQTWSGNPQLQDYIFTLFGTMALMFFAFYHASFDVGSGRRRMHLFLGLTALYLCTVNLSMTDHLFLYVGGIAWVLTDLCTLTPKPRPEPKETEGGKTK